jgi:hypothetical protein
MAIDDSIDAVKAQVPGEPTVTRLLDITLDLAGVIFPPATIAAILKRHFSEKAARERIDLLLSTIAQILKKDQREIEKDQRQIAEMRSRLDSPGFVEALVLAVEQSAYRTFSESKVRRFASVLANFAIRSDLDWDRAAAFIRDVSEISEDDIKVLTVLYRVFGDMMTGSHEDYRVVPFPQKFTERRKGLYDAAREQGYSDEDFESNCERLRGLGLVCLVAYHDSTFFPAQVHAISECFRPTKRGMELLSLLGVR